MKYHQVPEEYREEVKALAYLINPEAWVSYSGKTRAEKRWYDYQRNKALDAAACEWQPPEEFV